MALSKFNYLTLIVCFSVIVNGEHTPTISYITPPQTHDVGDRLELLCAVEYAEEYPVQWVKYNNLDSNDYLPLSYNSSLIIRDIRFSIRLDPATSGYYLSIKDLQESDAGWYQCQVGKAADDIVKADVELYIRKPPVFLNNTTRSLVTVAGDSAQLECYAIGFPVPNIYWRRENNEELPTGASIYRGNILKFTSIKHDDAGTYYCVAGNGVGKERRRTIDLLVEFAPIVFVMQPLKQEALNGSISLTCNVKAYPPPAITWFKENVQFSTNQHYVISNFGTSDDNIVSSLFVRNTEKSDYGKYTCKAKNKLGAAEATLELYEHSPTISSITPAQIYDAGDQLELACAVEHADEYPVQWVKYDNLDSNESLPLSYNSSLIVRDTRFSIRFDPAKSTYLLSIKDLQESDAGWYQCQVGKAADDIVKADVELHIRKPVVFLNNTTRSLLTVAGDSAQLECYATGFPAPNIYWRRENNADLPTGASIYRGNILKFPSIKHDDAGTYYCVAENGVDKERRRAIDLNVEFAPVVFGVRPRKQQALNVSVSLTCNVRAYPPPGITWFKEDVQLSSNQHYTISNFASSDDNVISSLFLDNTDKSDYGNYTCKAQNKLGAAEAKLELYELILSECAVPYCESDSELSASAP